MKLHHLFHINVSVKWVHTSVPKVQILNKNLEVWSPVTTRRGRSIVYTQTCLFFCAQKLNCSVSWNIYHQDHMAVTVFWQQKNVDSWFIFFFYPLPCSGCNYSSPPLTSRSTPKHSILVETVTKRKSEEFWEERNCLCQTSKLTKSFFIVFFWGVSCVFPPVDTQDETGQECTDINAGNVDAGCHYEKKPLRTVTWLLNRCGWMDGWDGWLSAYIVSHQIFTAHL